ncbi:hypothetical protein EVAR_39508_1 [Eumeta japonica]|uniref:Uncharacterized protein n=1 Tax=Eumeta variegata TaxID=151549 RepID=A0A4C1W307_EUMVA|nr:hypothetical protein EVAR_39508_1 [Eumeta japonica]
MSTAAVAFGECTSRCVCVGRRLPPRALKADDLCDIRFNSKDDDIAPVITSNWRHPSASRPLYIIAPPATNISGPNIYYYYYALVPAFADAGVMPDRGVCARGGLQRRGAVSDVLMCVTAAPAAPAPA